MARLSDWGERRLVGELLQWYGASADASIGDDAAILPMDGFHLLVTTDVVNPATHVPEGATPEQVGWYLVAVNLSDIAAMGGEPLGFLAALTLPRTMDVADLEGLAGGMRACAEAYGAPVLGGDTKEGAELSLCGVAVGRTRGGRVLRRRGCAPGDVLAVTGSLGRGGWAIRRLMEEAGDREAMRALLRLEPRIPEGLLLAADPGVTACMDISDGLAASLNQLAGLNEVSFQVEYEAVPATHHLDDASGEDRREALLYQGGDFELLFTVEREAWERLQRELEGEAAEITAIGAVQDRRTNTLVIKGKEEELESRGYEHFRPREG